MTPPWTALIALTLFPLLFVDRVHSGAIVLNMQNFDSVLSGHELVLVNYYANWCRFSQMLEPIFDEFADKLAQELPATQVAAGKVDCDVETTIASNNQVNKYPTLKLYRYGTATKKEYRGQRSVEAFITFIKEQIASPIKVAKSQLEYQTHMVEAKKRMLIAYFNSDTSPEYATFSKLASILRDSCKFIANIGIDPVEKIAFKENIDLGEVLYDGDINNYESVYAWANEKCTPLVREITFENAEELTEESLPFLILFHKPDDMESVHIFEKEVKRQLVHLKHTINAVYADGYKFSHPLHHLGKSASDLPLIAIDSFRHMYLFPDYKKLTEDNHLKQFVEDLHSGKLHREFHNGPDPTTTAEPPKPEETSSIHLPKASDGSDNQPDKRSTPPESVFIKLAPSRERYSLKNDEL